MTLDLHYGGIDVLTSSDVEAMIDRMLQAEAELAAARAEVARLRAALQSIKSRAEIGKGLAFLEDEAENCAFIIELVEAALAGGPR